MSELGPDFIHKALTPAELAQRKAAAAASARRRRGRGKGRPNMSTKGGGSLQSSAQKMVADVRAGRKTPEDLAAWERKQGLSAPKQRTKRAPMSPERKKLNTEWRNLRQESFKKKVYLGATLTDEHFRRTDWASDGEAAAEVKRVRAILDAPPEKRQALIDQGPAKLKGKTPPS